MRIALWFGVLVTGSAAWAATGPTILSVTGASGFSTQGTPTVFGGTAGLAAQCTASDAYTPCNSCTTAAMTCATSPLCACNTARIYDSLNLVVALSNQSTDSNGTSTTTAGNVIVTNATTTTAPVIQQYPNNGGASVTLLWSNICAATANQPTSCEGLNTNVSLNFYIDSNNNGIADSGEPYTTVNFKIISPDPGNTGAYSTFGSGATDGVGTFTPYPGDSQTYIKDPQTAANFPTLSYGSTVKNVRVYFSDQNLTKAQAVDSSGTQDLAVSDDGSSLAKNIVTGLSNGTRYFFRLGMLDEAGNVVQLIPDPAVDTDAASTECTAPTGGSPGCKYSATPDEVEGLLSHDINCFVATAAYGSSLEPKLAVFREFRRRVLLVTRFGRAVNHLYYRYGPGAARFIADRPNVRAVTRVALWPAFAFSWLSVRYGFALACAAVVVAVMTAWTAVRRGIRARG